MQILPITDPGLPAGLLLAGPKFDFISLAISVHTSI